MKIILTHEGINPREPRQNITDPQEPRDPRGPATQFSTLQNIHVIKIKRSLTYPLNYNQTSLH